MIYRNVKTGAVINTPCKISGKDWQEASPAGYPLRKKEEAPEEKTGKPAEEEKEAAEADGSERKQAKTEEKKAPAKGAVIRPKKVK